VNDSADLKALLEEIRDLLIPISRVYRSQYEDLLRSEKREIIERIIDVVRRGGKRRQACRLMDGSHGRKEIIEASAIDAGDLSRLIGKLRDEKLVSEDDGVPKLVVDPAIIWKE
jgi:hypothetical protein